MEILVHDYLTIYYKVETSKVGNDGIYDLNSEYETWYSVPVYGDRLLKELVNIFYIDEVTLRHYVNEWAQSKKNDINLTFFWDRKEFFFPEAQKVASRMIANDLVDVQPMSAPMGEVINDYITAHSKALFGELNHPEKPIFVSSRASVNEDDNTIKINIDVKPICGVKFIEHKINITKNLDNLE